MRTVLIVLFSSLAGVGIGADPAKAKDAPGNDQSAAVDQLAQQIFTEADKNHNHVLNKSEFRNAESLLKDEVDRWGREGLIGKPKKSNAKEKEIASQTDAVSASANRLSRSNKVSQAEFTFHAQTVVDQADEYWRQAKAAAAAQQKAISAQRRAVGPRGRGRWVPYPY